MEWSPRTAVYAGLFTALVFAATLVAVETPVTQGYFNLGESMVYAAAVLGGPLVGALAGGVGSALADLYLGYGHYAPGTLVIKGLEGLIVGVAAERLRRLPPRLLDRVIPLVAVGVGVGVAVAGALLYGALYGGETVLYVLGREVRFHVPLAAWLVIGAGAAGLILYSWRRWGPAAAASTAAMLLGGAWMVTGYFLYEAIVLGYGIRAAAEIPVNVGQALIGAVVATGVVAAVERARG